MSRERQDRVAAGVVVEVRKFLAGAILFNDKVAVEVGLNSTDLQCLGLLQLQGSATPGELAKCASVTTGGMTVVLDRLQAAGFVTREPNPKDRRSSIIRPVPAKMRRLERIYRSKGHALAHILSGYKERELRVILEFFQMSNHSQELG